MATPAFSLQYVQTAEDLRASFRRMRREWGREWYRIAAALFATWMAISSLASGYALSTTVLTTLAAVYFWVSPSPLIWLLYFWGVRRCRNLKVSIEIDDRSIDSHREDQKCGHRQYWSRLVRVEESDQEYELTFDGQPYAPIQVPFRAFVDDVQRHHFREFLTQHAPVAVEWRRRRDGS